MTRFVCLSLALIITIPTLLEAAGREIAPQSLGLPPYETGAWAVGSDGQGFLAAWVTNQREPGLYIDAAPVDGTGQLFSTVAVRVIRVSATYSLQVMPFAGHYAIAWTDLQNFNIAEVGADGHLIRMLVSRSVTSTRGASVTSNGDRLLLVQYDGQSVVDTLLDRDGAAIHAPTRLPDVQVRSVTSVDVADGFAVIMLSNDGVVAQRIARNGDLLARTVIEKLLFVAGQPRAASNGREIALVWQTARTGFGATFESAILTADDKVIRTSAPNTASGVLPTAFHWTGSQYDLVVNLASGTNGPTTPAVIRFDATGKKLDAAVVPIGPSARTVRASAVAGTTLYVLSNDGTNYSGPVNAATIDAQTLSVRKYETISFMPSRQASPAVTSDGTNFLAAWTEQIGNSSVIRARLLNGGGTPLQSVLELGTGTAPAIAYGGGIYLVVWPDGNELVARRILRDGGMLEDSPIVIAKQNGATFPASAIAWTGSQFVIVWATRVVEGALFSPAGNVFSLGQLSIDPPAPPFSRIFDGDAYVASNRSGVLLVWTAMEGPTDCCFIGAGVSYAVRAARLDLLGRRIDAQSTLIDDLALRATVATNGDGYAIVVDRPDGIRAYLIDDSSRTIKTTATRVVFNWWTAPTSNVTWTGADYLLSWTSITDDESWLWSAHLSPTGVVGRIAGVQTGLPDSTARMAIAANSIHNDVIVNSEVSSNTQTPQSARVLVYSSNALPAVAAAPSAPAIVDAIAGAFDLTVWWRDMSDNEEGFLIQAEMPDGTFRTIATAPANSQQASVAGFWPYPIRVVAWNGGGLSAPSLQVISHTRRRAARR